jgi:hypothetical protein
MVRAQMVSFLFLFLLFFHLFQFLSFPHKHQHHRRYILLITAHVTEPVPVKTLTLTAFTSLLNPPCSTNTAKCLQCIAPPLLAHHVHPTILPRQVAEPRLAPMLPQVQLQPVLVPIPAMKISTTTSRMNYSLPLVRFSKMIITMKLETQTTR